MLTCNINGGLGNQLFQICTTVSHAIDNNVKFIFINTKSYGKRNSYWTTLLQNLRFCLVNNLPPNIPKPINEKYFHYTPLCLLNTDINYILCGYFQSYKYFEHNYKVISKILKFNAFENEIKHKYPYDYSNSITIHFRLGDYVNIQDYHPVMKYNYYHMAIYYLINHLMTNELQFIYFCEKESNEIVENTISMLKKDFPLCNFIKANDTASDWEQMLMMSYCQHNIIANSTFSWWGAYLNDNKHKCVCYPNRWFGPKLSRNNTVDLFPSNWVKIIESD